MSDNPRSTRIARNAMCLTLLVGMSACAGTREPAPFRFRTNRASTLSPLREPAPARWRQRVGSGDLARAVRHAVQRPVRDQRAGPRRPVRRQLGRIVEGRLGAQRDQRAEPGDAGRRQPMGGGANRAVQHSVPLRIAGRARPTSSMSCRPPRCGLASIPCASSILPRARRGSVWAWNNVDQRQYSAANCVDRYADEGDVYRNCTPAVVGPTTGALSAAGDPSCRRRDGECQQWRARQLGRSRNRFRRWFPRRPLAAPAPPAQATPAATSGEGLQISLVDPVRKNDGLLIQGVVINTSNEVRAIPTMLGSLETPRRARRCGAGYSSRRSRRWRRDSARISRPRCAPSRPAWRAPA